MAAEYDLTHKVSPFLERHLIFPILQFLEENEIYDKEQLARAKIELLTETNMVDFAIDLYEGIQCSAEDTKKREELEARREKVLAMLEAARIKVLPLLAILESPEQMEEIKKLKSLPEICAKFELENDIIEALVTYARLQFQCGNYALSGDLLKHYRALLLQDSERPRPEKFIPALWGGLASHVLNAEWEAAAEQTLKLDDFLENQFRSASGGKGELLAQRTWLLHWALFVIFKNDVTGSPKTQVEKLLELFLNEKNLSIIAVGAPHLLRYVAACLILHKRLKHMVKDCVNVIYNESHQYKDPMTSFLQHLFMDLDFDEAQSKLQECKPLVQQDYFLQEHWTEIEENSRLLIFETYCRIHQCINIKMIAEKLNMEPEQAELWIVKLIQNAKLEARIDSEKNRVIMSKQPNNVYAQVIERTKNIPFRSMLLYSNLEKKGEEKKPKTVFD